MRSSSIVTIAASLLFAVGCGGGGDKTPTGTPNPGTTGAGSMSASIDGSAWTALAVTTAITNGVRIISGSDAARSVALSFVATGTGTQSISSTNVTLGIVIIGGQSWDANSANGGTGAVTITTLTSTRCAGTFTFVAKGSTASTSPATRQITNGAFDVRF